MTASTTMRDADLLLIDKIVPLAESIVDSRPESQPRRIDIHLPDDVDQLLALREDAARLRKAKIARIAADFASSSFCQHAVQQVDGMYTDLIARIDTKIKHLRQYKRQRFQ